MNVLVVLAFLLAVLAHVALLAFGGLLFPAAAADHGRQQEVALLSEEEAQQDEDEPETPEPADDELETETEEPPDAAELIKSLEAPTPMDVPALDAASLSAIEQALNGQVGGGDFASALTFASGGRIGGTGRAGPADDGLDQAFSLSEIDQEPRVMFQTSPDYPASLRGKKVEGVVTCIFVVDATGKVVNPRVEKSAHPAFDRPALDALRQWKFEPGVRGGQRVNCKKRISIRFKPL